MGTWRALHSRKMFHAPSVICVHDGVFPEELRTRAVESGGECFTDMATVASYFLLSCALGDRRLRVCSSVNLNSFNQRHHLNF